MLKPLSCRVPEAVKKRLVGRRKIKESKAAREVLEAFAGTDPEAIRRIRMLAEYTDEAPNEIAPSHRSQPALACRQ